MFICDYFFQVLIHVSIMSANIQPRTATKKHISLNITPKPRASASSAPDAYDDGHLRIEYDSYYIACGGKALNLPRKEFLLISRLSKNPNRIVAAQDLWAYAWAKQRTRFNAESLHVHIYRLRRKLDAHNLKIETMVGVGYMLRTVDNR